VTDFNALRERHKNDYIRKAQSADLERRLALVERADPRERDLHLARARLHELEADGHLERFLALRTFTQDTEQEDEPK
jgi:hypothetical protein